RIERVLLDLLIPKVDLPIAFLLQLADTKSSLIRVALAAMARARRSYRVAMGVKHNCGIGAIISFKISREVAEYPHGYPPRFPPEFHGHIEHQQAVDAGLVRVQGIRVR